MTALIELYGLTHVQLVAQICKTYGIGAGSGPSSEARDRRAIIARRLRLYRDQCIQDVSEAINNLYETDEYKRTLQRYVPYCVHENVAGRIVDEVASLYDRPALRLLPSDSDQLRAEEQRLNLHELSQQRHRLLRVCNDLLVWQFTGIDGKPKLRNVTPDMFDAIPDPRDRLVEAGILIDAAPVSMAPDAFRRNLPHYELWDDTHRYLINASGQLVDSMGKPTDAPLVHGLARPPWALLHSEEPTTTLLESARGSDIESAHLSNALVNVMTLRLAKSQGENQPVLSGNVAAMMSGQSMNGERPLVLPPEVQASMLMMKTDPGHYLAIKRSIITGIAQRYGMSYEQFTMSEGSDGGSGKAYAMRREKLTEIRLESRRRALIHERQILELLGFNTAGLRVDYQEQAIPTDAVEEVALLREKMKLGLDSPVTYVMRKDPDLDRDGAKQFIADNLMDFSTLILAVRALNIPAGGDASNPGQSPQQNGAMSHDQYQPVAVPAPSAA